MNPTKRVTLSALFLALGLVMPFLTMQIPEIGSMLLPMHFPVLICGFVCGWKYGLAVGFIVPLMRSFLWGMPPLLPTALTMAFELAAYGITTGLLFGLLKGTKPGIYIALVLSMIAGRLLWGLVSFAVYSILGNPFTLEIFIAGAFLQALPGIILQLLVIPPIIMLIQKSGALL